MTPRETILSTLKPGQKAKIPGWMNFSELVQALVDNIPRILEYEGNTPGEKLSRALNMDGIKRFRICWCSWGQYPDGVHKVEPFLCTDEDMKHRIRGLNDQYPEICHWSEEAP